MGLSLIMLTGDNQATGLYQELAGMDKVYARVMPEDKARIVEQIQKRKGHRYGW